jgi:hypothetical protein
MPQVHTQLFNPFKYPSSKWTIHNQIVCLTLETIVVHSLNF